mmetsp:Transcript_83292/g.165360  ORF Transcript_83292/g.165360 Transcript_83292/m.165360 type:complete len:207 (-) Transcript_83292:227-847(-)
MVVVLQKVFHHQSPLLLPCEALYPQPKHQCKNHDCLVTNRHRRDRYLLGAAYPADTVLPHATSPHGSWQGRFHPDLTLACCRILCHRGFHPGQYCPLAPQANAFDEHSSEADKLFLQYGLERELADAPGDHAHVSLLFSTRRRDLQLQLLFPQHLLHQLQKHSSPLPLHHHSLNLPPPLMQHQHDERDPQHRFPYPLHHCCCHHQQ